MAVFELSHSLTLLQKFWYLGSLLILCCHGLPPPECHFLPPNPQVGDIITLNCSLSANDTVVYFNWFHDGDVISDDQDGIEKVKLSPSDVGVFFTCEARADYEEPQNCVVQPLASPSDDADLNDDAITYIFIGIFALGGVLIVSLILACIIWMAKKTQPSRSYDLTEHRASERPRSDSFDDYDPEATVDERPAAPLPKAKQSLVKSNSKPATDIPLSFMEPPPPATDDSMYMNTARLHQAGALTLPMAAPTSNGKNIYLVPRSAMLESEEDQNEDSKLYANMPIGTL